MCDYARIPKDEDDILFVCTRLRPETSKIKNLETPLARWAHRNLFDYYLSSLQQTITKSHNGRDEERPIES